MFSLSNDDTTDDGDPLVPATLVARPSQRNRSPYVADVRVSSSPPDNSDNDDDATRRVALCHVPNLDMGGKCVPGATLLVKTARDRRGVAVGAHAVSPKYGTPKCEFIAQLLHVDESAYCTVVAATITTYEWLLREEPTREQPPPPLLYPPVWVGAHPSLGERIATVWLQENLLPLGSESDNNDNPVIHVQSQVTNPCGTDNMRSDFLVTHADGTKRIVEVKTVVDTDYSTAALPPAEHDSNKKKKKSQPRCVFTSDRTPYTRTAIFPWGNSQQKGPDGEPVVSARAIHHVRQLTRIARGECTDDDGEQQQRYYQATVLFVVARGDAQAFRPNHQACPSFARYLKEAADAGVQVLAKRVEFDQQGRCWDDHAGEQDSLLPIEWPVIPTTATTIE